MKQDFRLQFWAQIIVGLILSWFNRTRLCKPNYFTLDPKVIYSKVCIFISDYLLRTGRNTTVERAFIKFKTS